MEVDRRLEEARGECRPRGLAKPHAEIKDGLLAQPLQQIAVGGFRLAMGRQAMVEPIGAHGMEHGGSSRGHIAIDENRHPLAARGQNGARHGGQFAAPEPS